MLLLHDYGPTLLLLFSNLMENDLNWLRHSSPKAKGVITTEFNLYNSTYSPKVADQPIQVWCLRCITLDVG